MNKKMFLVFMTLFMSIVFISSALAATDTLRPDGQGNWMQWNNYGCSVGSSEWQCVDENPASTSDYLYTSGISRETFTFNNTNLTGPPL